METHIGKQHSLERFQAMVAWQNRVLALFGCYMYLGKERVSYRIVPICFMACSFVLLSLYSAIQARGNMGLAVLSIVVLFYGIIGVTRLAVAISNPAGCYRSIQIAEEMYQRANGSNPAECNVLAKYTDLFCKSVQLYTVCFVLSVVVLTLMPFALYLLRGERYLPLGIVLPFTAETDDFGFWCTLVVQLAYMYTGPFGLIPSQNIYFAFVFNICLQYELLIERLKQLDERIRSSNNLKLTVRDQLVKIIQLQQESTNYITHIERFYQLQSFVEFLCNSLQVALTLNELHRNFWLPGLFILPIAVMQMLILCSLGTLIELKSDQFKDQLYDIAWPEMDLPEQGMFKYVLKSAQQPKQLTCGRFAVINMNLFLAIHKKIYSFFMMLQNM
ncbi:AGAP004278-PA [Anopheles gambiae str. PEST]|uniref:AGAP004278-PA n=1 Tax=Anopheles gambiae TaxID=7165 RepID=Q7PGY2_ANOGA|nr:AGAP004278-PA [Anopheles gambiae str. PEST]